VQELKRSRKWDRLRAFGETCSGRVPHQRQRDSWDCGLTCVEMALRSSHVKCPEVRYEKLTSLVSSKSVWSIDLAYILAEYKVNMTFLTLTTGVHPGHSDCDFYKADLEKDRVRVEQLFTNAKVRGISVCNRSMSMRELAEQIGTHEKLAIVLIDVSKFRCLLCTAAEQEQPVRQTDARKRRIGFCGHFVLICGFDPETSCFVVKDPSVQTAFCLARAETLDAARRAQGTDEDIILVDRTDRCCT